MKGYKVFNPDFTCRSFQFEVGKTYEHKGELKICRSGFHFCRNVADCFNYYSFDPKNRVNDGLLFHEFMTAGENAFAVLGLENGQQEAPLWYKMDRMMQSASERISEKTVLKEKS